MKTTNSKKTALLLTGIILILCIVSLGAIFMTQASDANQYTAQIYVNGDLYQTIPLHQVTTAYNLTIASEDGGYNTVYVEPGAISISSADCPDQICVKQGAIRNSLLPITCLPHGLVIELKPTDELNANTPDILVH
ncbi:MAG: NusG domain II-containing protein [Lachnospiraceae bacterium]|nr:NusG domain II-containing protein [Lachnospiraceae bacterium]